jgi:uncharacterized protein (DUF2141 family)
MPTDSSTLTLELLGLRNRDGVLCIALFESALGYPDDSSQAVRTATLPITAIPQTVTFEDLPYGSYAATVLHDENADAQVNTNVLGIPKEGIGFSGNPRIWKGVPSFDRSEFAFTPDQTIVSITLKYFSV